MQQRRAKWEGDCDASDKQCIVDIDDDKNVTAIFKKKTYTLNVTVNRLPHGNNTSTVNVGSETCDGSCPYSFDYGANPVVTANASDGFIFTGWTGASCDGKTDPCTIPDGTTSISASFKNDKPILSLISPLNNEDEQEINVPLNYKAEDPPDNRPLIFKTRLREDTTGTEWKDLTCDDTNKAISVTCSHDELDYFKWYVWEATAIDQGTASTTEEWRFRTSPNAAPENPTNSSPCNKFVVEPNEDLEVSWVIPTPKDKDGDEVKYLVKFSSEDANNLQDLTCKDDDPMDNKCIIPADKLTEYGHQYYWMVVASDDYVGNPDGYDDGGSCTVVTRTDNAPNIATDPIVVNEENTFIGSSVPAIGSTETIDVGFVA